MFGQTQIRVEDVAGRSCGWRAASRAAALLLLLGMSSVVLADAASDVAKLDAQCEAAREAKIKPLRDAEIAKCKADARNDPDYCERYWRDYGNAVRRANGTMGPRMFDDLPACVAAAKAREALQQDGR
jgi:hypothetical protein